MAEDTYSDYERLLEDVIACFEEADWQSASEILAESMGQFPLRQHELTRWLAHCFYQLGEDERCIATLEYGLDQGFVYRLDAERFPRLVDSARFAALAQRNQEAHTRASRAARPCWEALPPTDPAASPPHPLLIALHQGRRDRPTLLRAYHTPTVAGSYVLALLRSSELVQTRCYGWEDKPARRAEIVSLVEAVAAAQPVDLARGVIVGTSQAGQMAIDMALRGDLPLRGFVAFCPPDAQVSVAEARAAAARGVRGVLVAGAHDRWHGAGAEAMARAFAAGGLPYRLVWGDHGHRLPIDAAERLEQALAFITG